MHFQVFLLSVISATGSLALFNHERAAATTSLNMASILSEASVLTAAFPASTGTHSFAFITPGGNLLQPPSSLVYEIITAVPASVIVDLSQPSLRSSIASEFKAGNTPSWFLALPSDVKSYIESLQTQIAGGGVNLSAVPSTTPDATGTGAGADGTADGKAKSTSSKAWAAKETGLSASLAVAAGVLGFMIAL